MIVAIDLGSNSLRVLVYDCKKKEAMGEYEKTVGTADNLNATGLISLEAQNRIISALKESIQKLQYNPKIAIAVTTQAMRVAKNNRQVLENIYQNTHIKFRIIEGAYEAKLTLLAIKNALQRENIVDSKFLVLDIGGGSTELIICNEKDTYVQSFPYGIVTLAQDKNRKNQFNELQLDVQKYLNDLNINLNAYIFVSTAGTPTTIAAMMKNMTYATYDKYKVNGTQITFDDIICVQNDLHSLSTKDLEIKVGTGRTEFIDTGIEIFKLFYGVLDKKSSTVFDDGLREGVAINECKKSLD